MSSPQGGIRCIPVKSEQHWPQELIICACRGLTQMFSFSRQGRMYNGHLPSTFQRQDPLQIHPSKYYTSKALFTFVPSDSPPDGKPRFSQGCSGRFNPERAARDSPNRKRQVRGGHELQADFPEIPGCENFSSDDNMSRPLISNH